MGAWSCYPVLECFSSMHEVLGLIFIINNKNNVLICNVESWAPFLLIWKLGWYTEDMDWLSTSMTSLQCATHEVLWCLPIIILIMYSKGILMNFADSFWKWLNPHWELLIIEIRVVTGREDNKLDICSMLLNSSKYLICLNSMKFLINLQCMIYC